MSGGRFNYMNDTAQSEIFGYWDEGKIPNVFEDREISELIYDVFNMTEERDKYKNKVWCFWHREYMDDMYYCADGLRKEQGEE